MDISEREVCDEYFLDDVLKARLAKMRSCEDPRVCRRHLLLVLLHITTILQPFYCMLLLLNTLLLHFTTFYYCVRLFLCLFTVVCYLLLTFYYFFLYFYYFLLLVSIHGRRSSKFNRPRIRGQICRVLDRVPKDACFVTQHVLCVGPGASNMDTSERRDSPQGGIKYGHL